MGTHKDVPVTTSLNDSILERDFATLRAIISNRDNEILDFRALTVWNKLTTTSSSVSLSISNIDLPAAEILANRSQWLSRILPPNEFDWLAWDQIGNIMSTNDACELFALISKAKHLDKKKEFYINGRRDPSLGYPLPHMSEALSQMKSLAKLVLRGLADNFMLRLISRFIPTLKHLDISFSQMVTDEGVFKLFFKDDVSMKAALFLIPTSVQKNLHNMWPLASTIEFLDITFTATTPLARKLVQLIPGCYTFKRLLTMSDSVGHGHFIFMRRVPDLSIAIRFYDHEDSFEAELQKFAGKKGATSFLTFVRRHPWRSCNLAIYKELQSNSPSVPTPMERNSEKSSMTIGIVTPSKEEKRIQGIVVFQSASICQLYSVFPIHLYHLYQACYLQSLQSLTGLIHDTSRHEATTFPKLTQIDILAEPEAFLSLLRACPILKKVRVRILRKPLTSEKYLEILNSAPCRNTLEELWIASGSSKKFKGSVTGLHRNSFTSTTSSINSFVGRSSVTSSIQDLQSDVSDQLCKADVFLFHSDLSEGMRVKDSRNENLIQLSTTFVQALVKQCQKLRRLGNLFVWNILESELEILCRNIEEETGRVINLIWDHFIVPNGCTFVEGKIYPQVV